MIKTFFLTLVYGSCLLCCSIDAISSSQKVSNTAQEDEGLVFFTPPAGWQLADKSLLPPHVKFMVVGKGLSTLPPSMNLSLEPYQGTLKEYLKTVKNMNAAQGYEWKDLGMIQTAAGPGSLSQVDTKTQWGEMRLMHVILLKNGKIYILTASALKEEFSLFYKDLFTAMRSLHVAKDFFDVVENLQQRAQLKTAVNKLQQKWQLSLINKKQKSPELSWKDIKTEAFQDEQFQNTLWKPFIEMINQKYSHLGLEWQSLFQQKIEDDLFNVKPE